MADNQKHTWMAMCELGHYFSSLGGVARPRNMSESEIHLYIACKLLELHDSNFSSQEYVSKTFLEAASPVLEEVNSYLSQVSLSPEDFLPFIIEYYEYVDHKLGHDKTPSWETLGVWLKECS